LTLEVIGATAFGAQLGDDSEEILKNFEVLLDEVKLRVDSKSNPKVMKKKMFLKRENKLLIRF